MSLEIYHNTQLLCILFVFKNLNYGLIWLHTFSSVILSVVFKFSVWQEDISQPIDTHMHIYGYMVYLRFPCLVHILSYVFLI